MVHFVICLLIDFDDSLIALNFKEKGSSVERFGVAFRLPWMLSVESKNLVVLRLTNWDSWALVVTELMKFLRSELLLWADVKFGEFNFILDKLIVEKYAQKFDLRRGKNIGVDWLNGKILQSQRHMNVVEFLWQTLQFVSHRLFQKIKNLLANSTVD